MKDAATNQIHHGMRAEDMLSYLFDPGDAHYNRHNVHTIGKKVGGGTAAKPRRLCLCASSRLRRGAVRPDKCGALLCRRRLNCATLRSVYVGSGTQ